MADPVQQDELLRTIRQVMSREKESSGVVSGEWLEPSAPTVHRAPPTTHHSPLTTHLTVLVAEDNEFNAELLEQLLGRRGHRVRVARNGREALVLTEIGAFDLLLLDIHMPELDGFQVVRAVRERERTTGGHLPVIALTARSRQEDREQCLAAGMDEFLAKPIQAADLWTKIEALLSSQQPQGQPKSPADQPKAGLLDPRALLAACGGDEVVLKNICRAFTAGAPAHLTSIESALDGGDAPLLREAAHKICGMIAAFSTEAGQVASNLEDEAAAGRLESCRPLVEQLVSLTRQLLPQLNGLSIEALRGGSR